MGKPKSTNKHESKALSISHPNSRKALRLAKQTIKEAARIKKKTDHAIRKNIFGEKLIWFQENLPENIYVMTAEQFLELFEKYLNRFNEELEQIAIKHSVGQRKNRQHASREDTIKLTIVRDTEEFNTCGIEMVDILQPGQLEIFKEWDGGIGKMNTLILKRFSREYLKNYKPIPIAQKYLRLQEEADKMMENANNMETEDSEEANDAEIATET